jgi:DUF4097 and DUF4098 domain-containing protein YvlB
MKKREVFIVILLITFGVLYNLYESGEVDIFFFDECSINPRGLVDRKHAVPFDVEENQYTGIKYLEITNPAGEVVIKKAENNITSVKPVIRVYHKNKDKAKRIRKEIEILTREDNGKVIICIEPEEKFPYKRVRLLFEVTVPEKVELKLYNAYGNIEITGTGKNITVNQRYGDIRVENVGSNLKIHSRHGKVSLSNISDAIDLYCRHSTLTARSLASLKLNASYSKISVAGVENETDIEYAAYCTVEVDNSGKFSFKGRQSRIRLNNIKNGVNIENSHNTVNMKGIHGDVRIMTRNCRINGDKIVCDNLILKNSYGNVDLSDITGKALDITVNNGDLDIKFNRVDGRINIKNKHSDILLDYPEAVRPMFNISLEYGKIINRTAVEYNIIKDQQRLSVSSSEGRPEIIIINTYGDIFFRNFVPEEGEMKVEPEEFI